MIYQMHPEHGRHIAYSPQEAETNHKNGWKTVTKEKYYAGIISDALIDDEQRNQLIEEYTEKYGKAPRKNISTDKLRAALDE